MWCASLFHEQAHYVEKGKAICGVSWQGGPRAAGYERKCPRCSQVIKTGFCIPWKGGEAAQARATAFKRALAESKTRSVRAGGGEEYAGRADDAERQAISMRQKADAFERAGHDLKAQLTEAQTILRHHNAQLADEQKQFGLLRGELHSTKAQLAAAQAEAAKLREALEWYEDKGRFCNATSREGDEARNALAKDIGKRARAALIPNTNG